MTHKLNILELAKIDFEKKVVEMIKHKQHSQSTLNNFGTSHPEAADLYQAFQEKMKAHYDAEFSKLCQSNLAISEMVMASSCLKSYDEIFSNYIESMDAIVLSDPDTIVKFATLEYKIISAIANACAKITDTMKDYLRPECKPIHVRNILDDMGLLFPTFNRVPEYSAEILEMFDQYFTGNYKINAVTMLDHMYEMQDIIDQCKIEYGEMCNPASPFYFSLKIYSAQFEADDMFQQQDVSKATSQIELLPLLKWKWFFDLAITPGYNFTSGVITHFVEKDIKENHPEIAEVYSKLIDRDEVVSLDIIQHDEIELIEVDSTNKIARNINQMLSFKLEDMEAYCNYINPNHDESTFIDMTEELKKLDQTA